jgi:hypothetical protein
LTPHARQHALEVPRLAGARGRAQPCASGAPGEADEEEITEVLRVPPPVSKLPQDPKVPVGKQRRRADGEEFSMSMPPSNGGFGRIVQNSDKLNHTK